MEIISNDLPEEFMQPGHSDGIFARAVVVKGHGLGIISFNADAFVSPLGVPATGHEKNGEKLQIVYI